MWKEGFLFPPLPAPSSAVYFLERPLTPHYSWARRVAVGEKRCPSDSLLHGLRRAAWLGGEISPCTELAANTLLAFPVCCHCCAEMGQLVPAVRGEVSLSTMLRDAQLPWRCFWKDVERRGDGGETCSREIAWWVGAGVGAVDGGSSGGKPSWCTSCPWLA